MENGIINVNNTINMYVGFYIKINGFFSSNFIRLTTTAFIVGIL